MLPSADLNTSLVSAVSAKSPSLRVTHRHECACFRQREREIQNKREKERTDGGARENGGRRERETEWERVEERERERDLRSDEASITGEFDKFKIIHSLSFNAVDHLCV